MNLCTTRLKLTHFVVSMLGSIVGLSAMLWVLFVYESAKMPVVKSVEVTYAVANDTNSYTVVGYVDTLRPCTVENAVLSLRGPTGELWETRVNLGYDGSIPPGSHSFGPFDVEIPKEYIVFKPFLVLQSNCHGLWLLPQTVPVHYSNMPWFPEKP